MGGSRSHASLTGVIGLLGGSHVTCIYCMGLKPWRHKHVSRGTRIRQHTTSHYPQLVCNSFAGAQTTPLGLSHEEISSGFRDRTFYSYHIRGFNFAFFASPLPLTLVFMTPMAFVFDCFCGFIAATQKKVCLNTNSFFCVFLCLLFLLIRPIITSPSPTLFSRKGYKSIWMGSSLHFTSRRIHTRPSACIKSEMRCRYS